MQINESKIAFICFHFLFRIWTFQRVTGEKVKKIPGIPTRVPGCAQNGLRAPLSPSHALLSLPALCRRDHEFRSAESIRRILVLAKILLTAIQSAAKIGHCRWLVSD
jgi:hypothetical protein